MGAAASIDAISEEGYEGADSNGDMPRNKYVLRQTSKNDEEKVNNVNSMIEMYNVEKNPLSLQASSHWHKMILYANSAKKSGTPVIDSNTSNESKSIEHNEESKTNNNDMLLPNPAPFYRQPTMREMAIQFRKDELEINKQKSKEFTPNTSISISNNTSSNNTVIDIELQKEYNLSINNSLMQTLPSLRMQLKSRTSSSIELMWDNDYETFLHIKTLKNCYNTEYKLGYEIIYTQYNSYYDNIMSLSSYHTTNTNDDNGKPYHRSIWKRIELEYNNHFMDDYDINDIMYITSNSLSLSPNKYKMNSASTTSNKKYKNVVLIDDLESDTKYVFKGRRVDMNIPSHYQYSAWCEDTVIRTGPGVPSCPNNIHAREISSTSILLCWSNCDRDNGLPVLYYVIRMKPFNGEFTEVIHYGKDKVYLATNLMSNTVWIFEVSACNKAGQGHYGNRLAIRTLPEGAPPITSWIEAIDDKTNKLYYIHPKSGAVVFTLPESALLDTHLSFKSKSVYLYKKIKEMSNKSLNNLISLQMDIHNEQIMSGNHAVKINITRDMILESTLRQLYNLSADVLLAGPMRVTFIGEEGVDGGGLAREWAIETSKQMIQPYACLFTLSETGKYYSYATM
jgi:hypothetical protein